MGSTISKTSCVAPWGYNAVQSSDCETAKEGCGKTLTLEEEQRRLLKKFEGLFDMFLPQMEALIGKQRQVLEEDCAVQAEMDKLAADHARAHEMNHSVECLVEMLAKRIMQDEEDEQLRQQELHKLEKMQKLKGKLFALINGEGKPTEKEYLGDYLEEMPELQIGDGKYAKLADLGKRARQHKQREKEEKAKKSSNDGPTYSVTFGGAHFLPSGDN